METILNSPQFKQALFDIQTEECELYAKDTRPVTFSPSFERKMDRLIRAQRQSYYPLINRPYKKALLALAATFILLTTMVFSVSALREPVVRFLVEVYEKFSLVFYHQEAEEAAELPATIETYYAPAWLPEGYALDDDEQTEDAILWFTQKYIDASGDEILFMQFIISSGALIDTENIQAVEVKVHGYSGLFYSNKEIQNLVWNTGQYGFRILGPVTEADLLRMAESITVT